MENKQTAVEWLVEQLSGHDLFNTRTGNSFRNHNNMIVIEELINQAKEIERDQLILFGAQCMVESEKESGLGAIRIYELYFDKTFKSEEQ